MNNKKISGYVMFGVGGVILLINAISYIFGLDFKHPALTVMGLVFVVVGMKIVRKKIN
jgi:hypothetical protein